MNLQQKVVSLTDGQPNAKKALKLIAWLQKKKLLRTKMKCKYCKNKMKLERKDNTSDFYRWVCRHRSHGGKKTKTIRSRSFFENSRTSLFSWTKFFYRFSEGLRTRQLDMMTEGIAKSSATLSKMASRVRAVCRRAISDYAHRKGQRLGDDTEFVVIDESNFRHKRKYARGRIAPTWKRRKWVFGMLGVTATQRRPILRLVKRRSRHHLIPLVVKHVRPGSVIISDEWRAYRRALSELGYRHFTVNHSRWFVDPNSGAHTQHLERAWLTYKSTIWRLRGNRNAKLLKEHLTVIEWTYWLAKKHKKGLLGRLIKDIKAQYPC